jgi:D-alanyl-D-alanine carboxypeptidase
MIAATGRHKVMRFRATTVGLVCGAALALASPVAAQQPYGVSTILLDENSGEVLLEDGADQMRHPASITKIMTLYLAFEAIADGRLRLDDKLVMSRHAAYQKPSRLGLGIGRSLPVEQAIRIVAVKSANDLAMALAERVGGSEHDFVGMMNRKAAVLGMSRTHFDNPTGLPDPENITTARDIATLSAALMRNFPRYYTYFSLRSASYGRQTWANHNKLLGHVFGLDGIKTGYTADSGFTLAASAVRNGRRLIGVILGAPSPLVRNRDMTDMLEQGFAQLSARAGELGHGPAPLVTPRLPYNLR